MSNSDPKKELKSQIIDQISILEDAHDFLDSYMRGELPNDGKSRVAGLVVAGMLENYYTAVETILFRIVQEFGNELDPQRRHASILERLSLEVEGTRPRCDQVRPAVAPTGSRLETMGRRRNASDGSSVPVRSQGGRSVRGLLPGKLHERSIFTLSK